jgi:hypothetical protein
MIERDYIMRILQEFFTVMAKLAGLQAEDPDTPHIRECFDRMYEQFFRHPATYYYETEKEDITDELEKEGRSEHDTLGKVQMLSELLYRDGLIQQRIPEKCMLLEKSLYLLEYLDRNSRTFSWERSRKMREIKKALTEFEIR